MTSTKTLGKILLAAVGSVALATGAWAAGVGQVACSTNSQIINESAVQVASQLVTPTSAPTIDLGGAATWPGNGLGVNRNLLYAPNIDVTTDSTIRFDFTGFAVKGTALNKYYLRVAGALDGVPPAPPTTWQVGTLVDFTPDANGNYTSMTFKVVPHDSSGLGLGSVPNVDDRIGAAQVVVISAPDEGGLSATYTQPKIVLNKGLAQGASGTMQVSAVKDATGVAKDAPVSGVAKVFDLINGLNAHVYQPTTHTIDVVSTSTIDVAPAVAANARKVFVSEGLGTDTPDITDSTVDLRINNVAEYGFKLDANDNWYITLKRANIDGVQTASLGGNVMTKTVGQNQWTMTGTFSGVGANLNLASGAYFPLNILVNGTTVLQNGTWTVDLSVDTDDVGMLGDVGNKGTPDQTLMTAADAIKWDTNGAQFAVPYFHTDITNFGTALVVTNQFSAAAGMQMDIWSDTGVKKSGIILPDLPANSTVLITPAQIQAAASGASGDAGLATGNHRYMAIFTVNAPADQILTTALQNNPDGTKRTMNVMTKGSDAKAWKW